MFSWCIHVSKMKVTIIWRWYHPTFRRENLLIILISRNNSESLNHEVLAWDVIFTPTSATTINLITHAKWINNVWCLHNSECHRTIIYCLHQLFYCTTFCTSAALDFPTRTGLSQSKNAHHKLASCHVGPMIMRGSMMMKWFSDTESIKKKDLE